MTNTTTWKTYATRAFTFDVANDRASQGGVHLHQVRRTASGHWQKRILQSNGNHRAPGPVEAITEAEGEALYATAEGLVE